MSRIYIIAIKKCALYYFSTSRRTLSEMTTLYLIRHGQKQSHAGDPGLTNEGIIQAQQTGRYLRQFPITKIISSPFLRTVETARYIAVELGLDHLLHDALAERMNWNDPEVTRQQFLQEWIKATQDREYIPQYGDSSRSTGRKIEHLIREVAAPNEHIVLVSHGGAIVDYLRNIVGDESLSVLRTQYEEGEDYQMMNCAINQVILSDPPGLKLLNFIGHLADVSE